MQKHKNGSNWKGKTYATIGGVKQQIDNAIMTPSKSDSRPFALTKSTLVLLGRLTGCMRSPEPTLLVGETGAGKTTVVRYTYISKTIAIQRIQTIPRVGGFDGLLGHLFRVGGASLSKTLSVSVEDIWKIAESVPHLSLLSLASNPSSPLIESHANSKAMSFEIVKNSTGRRPDAIQQQRVGYIVTQFSPSIQAVQHCHVYQPGDDFIVGTCLCLHSVAIGSPKPPLNRIKPGHS
ncbi:hypothetical protein MJO28_015813 [Puccinia striiformis f. sp. tritici]|uniref:Uncharacterized protein n=1 Tax=Puccinia striiformis f. sp. tritici TaxID=168172 RepID=A0ACC0DRG2_9BASI|nr:hypothetical protein MJO28_015813 [Puccinia striiformis f. sp. tritici]